MSITPTKPRVILLICLFDIISPYKLVPPQARPAPQSIPKAPATQNADLTAAAVYHEATAGSSSSHVHSNAAVDPSMETSLDASTNHDLAQKAVEISATEAMPLSAKNVIRLSGEPSAVDIINQHKQRLEYANSTGTLPLCTDVCSPSYPIKENGTGAFTCTARTVLRRKRANGQPGTTGCTQDAQPRPSDILTTDFLQPNQQIDNYIVSEIKGRGADGQLYFAKEILGAGIKDHYVAIKRGPATKPIYNIKREFDVLTTQLQWLNSKDGILQPLKYFADEVWMYMVMPRMGTTFEWMLNEWGYDSSEYGKTDHFTFSLMTACSLGRTAVPVMAKAHEYNVAHTDLNMGNFILGLENTLKTMHVIDWVNYVSMQGLDHYSAARLKIIKDDFHKLRRELEILVGHDKNTNDIPFFRVLEAAIDALTIDEPVRTIQKVFDRQILREYQKKGGQLDFWAHDLEKEHMSKVLQVEDLVHEINEEFHREANQ